MKKAVLFLTYNRLDMTKQVFAQIALAKPPKLYFSSDGAKNDIEGDHKKVEQIRQWVLENINWDCEVKTRFNTENMSCGKGVSSAITWFFENEEDGIILEDDTVPHQSFFNFCEELLDKYKDNKNVWHISGYNPIEDMGIVDSYIFNTLMLCWGWATWSDRWLENFTLDLKDIHSDMINGLSENSYQTDYYKNILKTMQSNNPINSWAYPWALILFAHKALCATSTKNLVSNIGVTGVHYQGAYNDPKLNSKTYDIYTQTQKLEHPREKRINKVLSDTILCKIIPVPTLHISEQKTPQVKPHSVYHKASYSQDGEDVVFSAFFETNRSYKGFYVDIGAHHPERFSNTKILYDMGWRGINIDATPSSMGIFKTERPNDINLEIGISDSEGFLDYYSFEESALNSFDKELSEERIAKGWALKDIIKIKTDSITNILSNHLPKGQKIDLISMDIEGFEMQVLQAFDFTKYAPDYFYIEALELTNEDFTKLADDKIYKFLKKKGYYPVAKTMRTVLYKHKHLILKSLQPITNKLWNSINSYVLDYAPYTSIADFAPVDFTQIKSVAFQISNICNYSKIHKECPIYYFTEKEILPTEIIYKTIDELGSEYRGRIMFSVYNEPLSDDRFFELCQYSKTKCPHSVLYLLTNGSFTRSDSDVEKYKNFGVDLMKISAYSKSEYERLRKINYCIPCAIEPMPLDNRISLYDSKPICLKRPCFAPYSDITISSNGDVVACCLDYKRSVVFGSVMNDSLLSIINKENTRAGFNELKQGARTKEICKRCTWSRV